MCAQNDAHGLIRYSPLLRLISVLPGVVFQHECHMSVRLVIGGVVCSPISSKGCQLTRRAQPCCPCHTAFTRLPVPVSHMQESSHPLTLQVKHCQRARAGGQQRRTGSVEIGRAAFDPRSYKQVCGVCFEEGGNILKGRRTLVALVHSPMNTAI